MREIDMRVPWAALAELGIEELVRALHDSGGGARFRSLACHGCSGTCMVEVETPLETAAIANLPYVDEIDLVGHGPDRLEYLLRMELPRCQEPFDRNEGEFYVTGPVEVGDDGVRLTAIATQEGLDTADADLAGLDAFMDQCEILRVGSYDGRPERLDALTDRQQEILAAAYERGYFEVPRRTDAEALAAEFDLDKSTVLEHLRRAERNLLGSVLDRGRAEAAR